MSEDDGLVKVFMTRQDVLRAAKDETCQIIEERFDQVFGTIPDEEVSCCAMVRHLCTGLVKVSFALLACC